MSFHVGQKVVCVNAVDDLVKDKIYTINVIFDDFISVDESWFQHSGGCFFSWRFRPIQGRKTDIGFAHEILKKFTRKNKVSA